MATKLPKKKEQVIPVKPPIAESTPLLVEHKGPPKKQKLSLNIPGFQSVNALMKLRVVITILFVLFTLAIVLIFTNGYMISAVLFILGYLLLLILMIKLFRIKNL